MAISYEILTFPSLSFQGQLFRVPGQTYDGGFTSGSARVSSPEPGGRAFLDVQLSLQTKEWEDPAVSWLMSKLNGDIFSIKLAKTPQLLDTVKLGLTGNGGVPWNNGEPWNNGQPWDDVGLIFPSIGIALEGSTTITFDMTGYGEILRRGHVVGIGNYSYLVDNIEYVGNSATIRVKPPLRKDVDEGDYLLTRPLFLGQIINGQEFAANYEAINNGHIKPPRLVFAEVIL